MIIIPAIDIKGGRCVRLSQGRMEDEVEYAKDPVEVAKKWASLGGELIHLVDLDAAIEGRPVNIETIKAIASSVDVPVQVGGGIRNMETAESYLSIPNLKRIIIGTAAFKDEAFLEEVSLKYPGRVAVGIDAKDGFVAIEGWVELTDIKASELTKKIEHLPISCIVYTDIARDGMLTGPNIEATKALADSTKIPVVASGGVSKLSDLIELSKINVEGSIVGKAIYTGDVDLKVAIEKVKNC